ncbi:CDP-glycerol glycerophosphotransferase family protein [Alkalibacillus aidingensis]|uniref:CDP-glycerol glycerophosphotransferase family protein n=1 Tax=Alkalibacillus aidingensis TaxID=2747607 RepID=UPI0016607A3A|nr:CDP-glycerol glycerophosphotransferase family protein [Alkalibacillus aidingensis]
MGNQLSHYEKNYWSLYLEFLKMFENLQYGGFSLSYLCHFGSLIRRNQPLLNSLKQPGFYKTLHHQVTDDTDIQMVFNEFVKKHSRRQLRPAKGGKVVLYDVYNLLRIPNEILRSQFKPSRSLIMMERHYKRNPRHTRFPTEFFDQYSARSKSMRHRIKKVKNQAQQLMEKYSNHSLVQNEHFQKNFLQQIEKIINRMVEARNLFSKVTTACVIVPSTHYPESRTLVMVAAEKGIPTICLQHGIFSSGFGYLPKVAYIDGVYGHFEEQWYQDKGVNSSELKTEIIGHPRFDLIFKKPTKTKKSFQDKVGIEPYKKTILLAVRGRQNLNKWRQFLRAITKNEPYNIILRDFPNVHDHPLLKEFSNLKSTKGFHLHDVIHHVDAVVTYSSTVGLESMIAGKPVFIFNQSFPGYTGYYDMLDELVQEDPIKLAKLVDKYFEDERLRERVKQKREQFLAHAYPKQEGTAGRRLTQLIKRLS